MRSATSRCCAPSCRSRSMRRRSSSAAAWMRARDSRTSRSSDDACADRRWLSSVISAYDVAVSMNARSSSQRGVVDDRRDQPVAVARSRSRRARARPRADRAGGPCASPQCPSPLPSQYTISSDGSSNASASATRRSSGWGGRAASAASRWVERAMNTHQRTRPTQEGDRRQRHREGEQPQRHLDDAGVGRDAAGPTSTPPKAAQRKHATASTGASARRVRRVAPRMRCASRTATAREQRDREDLAQRAHDVLDERRLGPADHERVRRAAGVAARRTAPAPGTARPAAPSAGTGSATSSDRRPDQRPIEPAARAGRSGTPAAGRSAAARTSSCATRPML